MACAPKLFQAIRQIPHLEQIARGEHNMLVSVRELPEVSQRCSVRGTLLQDTTDVDPRRTRYSRAGLRYPSHLTDEEWAEIAPLLPPARRGGRQRSVNVRAVLNGIL